MKNNQKQNKSKKNESKVHRESLDRIYALWVLLNQARDSIHRARDKELMKYGFSTSQAAVLFISKMIEDEVTPTEISRWLLKEPHTVSAILSRMERQGLVKKVRNADKKSSVNVALTESGERAYLNAKKIKSIKDIMSCLTEEESKQLNSILSKLRDVAIDYSSRVRVPFP